MTMYRLKNVLLKFFAVGFMLLVAVNLCVAATKVVDDAVVAVVNDEVITEQQVRVHTLSLRDQIRKQGNNMPDETQLKKHVLSQLIDQIVQRQLAEQMGMTVDDEEIDQTIDKIAKKQNTTAERLLKTMSDRGLSVADFRNQIRTEILINQLEQREVAERISVSDAEINNYMHTLNSINNNATEYHVLDLLVGLPNKPTSKEVSTAKTKAETFMVKLRQGADFKSLAMNDSASASALQGGDLGWKKLAELPEIFVQSVNVMKDDEIAGPIRAPNGFHVIKLIGKRIATADNSRVQDLEADQQLRSHLREMIFKRKFEQNLQSWLSEIRDTAHIEIKQPAETKS